MAYTVNKLAKLSSVSARTLRFYDEIGLCVFRPDPNTHSGNIRTPIPVLTEH